MSFLGVRPEIQWSISIDRYSVGHYAVFLKCIHALGRAESKKKCRWLSVLFLYGVFILRNNIIT